jgi:lysophospholipase L1-like esterase
MTKLRIYLQIALFILVIVCNSCKTNRICCLGDSVTQGTAGLEKLPRLNSYRYPLWEMLDSAGYKIDMVGSTDLLFKEDRLNRLTYPKSPSTGHQFDPDHEGHFGWQTGEILDSLPYWLQSYTPDIVLIHLGNNDFSAKIDSSRIAGNLKNIIWVLRLKNPEVKVVLARLITVWCKSVNSAVPLIARELSTEKSPVVLVDMATGFINDPALPGTLTYDWAHPNEKGEKWMAKKWFDALKPLLK